MTPKGDAESHKTMHCLGGAHAEECLLFLWRVADVYGVYGV